LINAVTFDDFVFPISKKGLQINHSELIKFSKNPFSKYGFFNVPLWNIAEVPLANTPFANTIIINENNYVTECIGSNIFAIKGRELFTPAVETGCYIDTLRSFILEAATGCSLKINENSTLTKEGLLQMNEIFIASEEKGIDWIMGIQNKRFVHQVSDEIQLKINEILKAKVV
jgi:branched-chain amino acid aminotransferase